MENCLNYLLETLFKATSRIKKELILLSFLTREVIVKKTAQIFLMERGLDLINQKAKKIFNI